MSKYNLKFNDLEEGKTYENYCNKHTYKLKNGGLISLATNEYSAIGMDRIMNMNFKEVKEPDEITLRFLSTLKDGWLTKNKNGDVAIHQNKPYKKHGHWCSLGSDTFYLYGYHLSRLDFSFVSWEDEEPIKISTLLKRKG